MQTDNISDIPVKDLPQAGYIRSDQNTLPATMPMDEHRSTTIEAPTPIDPFLASVDASIRGCRGVGANAQRFRALINYHPLLKVDIVTAYLNELVANQRRMLEIALDHVYPFEDFLAKQNFNAPRVDSTPKEVSEGTKPGEEFLRRPFLTNDISDGIYEVIDAVKATKKNSADRKLALKIGVDTIFSLIGYAVIRDAFECLGNKVSEAVATEARALIARCEDIRANLHNHNARLIMREAVDLSTRTNASLDDLLQEGSLGLLEAIDRYMPGQGIAGKDTMLSTVAKRWIRHKMTRWLSNNSQTIRRPDHIHKKDCKLARCRRELMIQKGTDNENDITDEELAKYSGLSLKDVRVLRYELPKVTSLSAIVSNDEGKETSLEAFIPDDSRTTEDMVDEIDQRDTLPVIYEALGKLGLVERLLLSFEMGFPNGAQGKVLIKDFAQSKLDALVRRASIIRQEHKQSANPMPRVSVMLVNAPHR